MAIAGRATRFEQFDANVDIARGTILAVDNRAGVDGTVMVSIRGANPSAPDEEIVKQGTVSGGQFGVILGSVAKGAVVQAHYLGDFRYAPSDSKQTVINQ